ncbi:MAG: ABC transporter substrate-binding protein [Patescibacteria group bacterium]
MTKTAKTILAVIIIVVIIVIAIVASRKGGAGVANAEPIKIGVITPLSGDGAVYGEPARNVYQLAVDEINAAGGIGGKQIVLAIEDSKCNGKDAVSATQKLITVEKVQIIIGGVCSSESLASVPVLEAAKVAMFSPAASSPDLTGKSLFFSRDYPSDASQGSVLAQKAFDLGYRKVAFIQEQTDYALGIYKAFTEKFQSLGGTVIKEEFPTTQTDFRSSLAKLQSEKPDMLLIDAQTAPGAGRILKQLTDLKWKVKLFTNDIVFGLPDLIKDNAQVLEGAIAAEFKVNASSTRFAQLITNYKTKYGSDMPYQSYGQTEYDSIYLIRDAIAAVGYDGQKIAAWLRTVKNWDGASGSVTIGDNGDRIGGHSLEVLKNGKIEPLI